jgi:hypothetical protein
MNPPASSSFPASLSSAAVNLDSNNLIKFQPILTSQPSQQQAALVFQQTHYNATNAPNNLIYTNPQFLPFLPMIVTANNHFNPNHAPNTVHNINPGLWIPPIEDKIAHTNYDKESLITNNDRNSLRKKLLSILDNNENKKTPENLYDELLNLAAMIDEELIYAAGKNRLDYFKLSIQLCSGLYKKQKLIESGQMNFDLNNNANKNDNVNSMVVSIIDSSGAPSTPHRTIPSSSEGFHSPSLLGMLDLATAASMASPLPNMTKSTTRNFSDIEPLKQLPSSAINSNNKRKQPLI